MPSPGDQISPEVPAECRLGLSDLAHPASQDGGLVSLNFVNSG